MSEQQPKESSKDSVEKELLELRLKKEILEFTGLQRIHEILDHAKELRYIQ